LLCFVLVIIRDIDAGVVLDGGGLEIEANKENVPPDGIVAHASEEGIEAGNDQEGEAVPGPSGLQQATSSSKATSEGFTEERGNEDVSPVTIQGKWLSYADLMGESYPAKSKVVYLKAYKNFEKFLKANGQWKENVVPSDLDVLNYFHHLKHELRWAPTTLWSTYARINAVMKRVYGVSLNSYSRVSDVLKSYDSGHTVKQAGIFTPQQIEDFISDPQLSSKYWLVRKVVCLVGYYGGFRNVELKSLKFENLELDCMGYWFSFSRAKQRGRVEETKICIPRRQADWIPVVSDSSRMGLDFDPASLIDLYVAEVERDLQCSRDELKGDFFRATHGMKGQKFTQLTLGKNTIGKVGVQVATELCLPRPEIYTGHCWRRSCGTSASDSGVNVTTLMSMMGWSNPKTAMVYVKKSRMTSLSMSLYLANVQRSNCSNPFPRTNVEKREVVRQVQAPKTGLVKGSRYVVGTASSSCVEVKASPEVKEEEGEVDLGTQELISEIEGEEKNVIESKTRSSEIGKETEREGNETSVSLAGSGSSSASDSLTSVDPRLSGFLHNLQNSGSMTIHFHFDGK
jgi:integrase